MKSEFVSGKWSKPKITRTTKAMKFGVVRWDMIWGDEIKSGSGKPVYEVDNGGEGK